MWMDMVGECGARVALVDAPDRIKPRRLLKSGGNPERGVLSMDDVAMLTTHAKRLGLRVLWSGGITADEAFRLGKLEVGGIFATGSTAVEVAVTGTLVDDPQLAAAREPTETGVRRIHALLQGGFLTTELEGRDAELVATLERDSRALIDCPTTGETTNAAIDKLDGALIRAWKLRWS